jgi:uncharacterized protein (TIGR02147 family)
MTSASSSVAVARQPASAGRIFGFASFGAFLGDYVQRRREAERAFSFAVMGRSLKLRSRSLLPMIARGERFPSAELLDRLAAYMGLNADETRYAEALVGFHRSKSVPTRLKHAEVIRVLKPSNDEFVLEIDTLEMISRWHHVAVLELTELPTWREEPTWIASALGPSVTPAMAEESLALLQRLGRLLRDETGRLRKANDVVRTTKSVSGAVVRSFHKQMLTKAHAAIERQPMDERYFTGLSLPIPTAKLGEARRLIAEFRDAFLRQMGAETPDEVYHLAVQLFRLTPEPIGSTPPKPKA